MVRPQIGFGLHYQMEFRPFIINIRYARPEPFSDLETEVKEKR